MMLEEGVFEEGIWVSPCFSPLLDSIKLRVAGPDPFIQVLLDSSLTPLTAPVALAYISLAVF